MISQSCIQRRQHQAFWAVSGPQVKEPPYIVAGTVSTFQVRMGLLALVFDRTLLLESVTMDQLPSNHWRIQARFGPQSGATHAEVSDAIWAYLDKINIATQVPITLEVRPLP